MKPYIIYIGVLDKENCNHAVKFTTGLNVVTGKSSTGKSALIEIFDYCFGSSEYTIPVGKITEKAKLYYTIFKTANGYLILGRTPKSRSGFIKEVTEIPEKLDLPTFTFAWFQTGYFLELGKYKKEIGLHFKLNIDDIETNEELLSYRNKKPSPSIRSFTSFMLQHQNLIANKHAIFYRFDEKEKREQAIEHFKIFLGFADQEYFLLNQKLSELEKQKRQLEFLIPKKQQLLANRERQLNTKLQEYQVLSGKPLLVDSIKDILNNPARYLDKLHGHLLEVDSASPVNNQALVELETKRLIELKLVRKLESSHRSVTATIRTSKEYYQSLEQVDYPEIITESAGSCPFCESTDDKLENEANALGDAIGWLNNELSRSNPLNYSYESKAKSLSNEINIQRDVLKVLDDEISTINRNNAQLTQRQKLEEQLIKAKLTVEIYLEELIRSSKPDDIENKIEEIKIKLSNVRKDLKKYSISKQIEDAHEFITQSMNKLGQNLDFEAFYKPVKLDFSLESFDIWQNSKQGKVFLRSMGSGANWLYCHLSLFLSLHKLFCKLEDCMIPPTLFIDQPTQVYFPNVSNDKSDEFKAKDVASGDREERLDEDINSVENFFDEIITFCNDTKKETGNMPQIIVSDHADHLTLKEDRVFEDYVRARWRTRGFIAE